ncbi:MAG: tRNA (guanosine(37)-N1)-methyltransferase TrmD [Oscillospiraceae bacterium]|nr:tRNA (guanosine(37)-N1)-methyltransferase TrmD [Oscillospiraceae bacterium]
MRFHIITLFPDMIRAVLSESIIGRGEKKGYINIEYYQLRDYSDNKHRTVDDTVYGGGMGMLLTAMPIYSCHKAICKKIDNIVGDGVLDVPPTKSRTVYMSPKGSVLTQKKSEELSKYTDLIILCGHYEGIDERIIDEVVDEEISIGDYILTGGELPCAILVDCVARLIDGVLSDPECHEKESISSGLLEYPQYTKPFEFMGREVPEVLISGHHANIERWRKEQSIILTFKRRPDLFKIWLEKNLDSLDKNDMKFLKENNLL